MYSLPAGSTIANGDLSDASDLNSPLADIAADLNIVRPIVAGGTGASSAPAALVALGLTATAAEINVLDGVTSTTAELNILDGVTSTAAELNLVDGSVAGTIVNSKAVVYGAAGQVNATTLQIAGVSVTSTAAELNFVDGVTSNVQTQLNARALTSTAVTAGNGLTGGGTLAAAMTLTVGAGTGIAVAATTVGLTGQALALHNLATNGLIARTGAGTVAGRALVGGTGITMTNGDGVAGNPSAAITIATQAQAEAGTDNTTVMTPLRFRNAVRATGSAPTFAPRAWVRCSALGSVFASGNISSVSRTGTGEYVITFATAMQDINYSVSGTSSQGADQGEFSCGIGVDQRATTSFRIHTRRTTNHDLFNSGFDLCIIR